MKTELRNHLKNAVPALNINWGWHTEGAPYPYATLADRFTSKEYTHEGPNNLKRYSVDLSVWGKNYKQVTDFILAYEHALDSYSKNLMIDQIRIEDDPASDGLIRGYIQFHIHA